jgi:hypothetical protein
MYFIFFCLLILFPLNSISFQETENPNVLLSSKITKIINNYRTNFKIFPVSFDQYEHKNYRLYQIILGKNWFSMKNDYNWTLSWPTVRNKNKILEHNAVFIYYWPSYIDSLKRGWKFLFSYPNKKLSNILSYGESCYDEKMCNKNNFTNYISCIKKNERCNGSANIYFPKIIDNTMGVITAVIDDNNTHLYGRYIEPKCDYNYYCD